VSVPPGKREAVPVKTTRHAFPYVFAGCGKFRNASGHLAVPTEGAGWSDTALARDADDRSLVLFDSGDEVVVQAAMVGGLPYNGVARRHPRAHDDGRGAQRPVRRRPGALSC
jgi:hypothetical protein